MKPKCQGLEGLCEKEHKPEHQIEVETQASLNAGLVSVPFLKFNTNATAPLTVDKIIVCVESRMNNFSNTICPG